MKQSIIALLVLITIGTTSCETTPVHRDADVKHRAYQLFMPIGGTSWAHYTAVEIVYVDSMYHIGDTVLLDDKSMFVILPD
jgi:hypothetical protein